MADFAGAARRLYRLLLGVDEPGPGAEPGVPAAADGATAVAVVEALAADALPWSGVFPAGVAEGQLLEEGGPGLTVLSTSSARTTLAAASGLAATGRRAAAFCSDTGLDSALDLLAAAAGRGLPLVVHTLCDRDHAALHRAASRGATVLVAATAQEAVDLALVARRVAEETLVPVVLAQDVAETALAVQDLDLPRPGLVSRYLGAPGDPVHPPTPAQVMLFGEHRRRVPRWHDVGVPLVVGAAPGSEASAAVELSRRALVDAHVASALEAATRNLTALTGRDVGAVAHRGATTGPLALVAIGSAADTATRAVEALRKRGTKAGLVSIRQLQPFPTAAVAEAIGGRTALVLERSPSSIEGSGSLTALVAGSRARQSAESRARGRRPPATEVSACYGLRGAPLADGPLVAVALDVAAGRGGSTFVLGTSGTRSSRDEPKREVVLGRLRAAYPTLDEQAVQAPPTAGTERPANRSTVGISLGVSRRPEDRTDLAGALGVLLHRLAGGHVRSLFGSGGPERVTDRVEWADSPLQTPDPEVPPELLVWLGSVPPRRVREMPTMLVALAPEDPDAWLGSLSPALARRIAEGVTRLYLAPAGSHSGDRLLGATLGVLRAEGRLHATPRRLLEARREMLATPDSARLDAIQVGMEHVHRTTIEAPAERGPSPAPPAALQRFATSRQTLDCLPRFADQIASTYRGGGSGPTQADPTLALAVLPAGTGALLDPSPTRTTLPRFEPGPCTACGACWTLCPHGAVEPAVATAGSLLDLGMAVARRRGAAVDGLRMVSSRLAGSLDETLAKAGGGDAGALLETVGAATIAALPAARRAKVAPAVEAVVAALRGLPVAHAASLGAATPPLSLSVAIDPDACTGCGICIAECEPGALVQGDPVAGSGPARGHRRLVGDLPDAPDGAAVALLGDPAAGPLAAAMVSRRSRRSLVAGGPGEPGSGSAVAMRQLLAIASHRLDPIRRQCGDALDTLREELAQRIHERLSDALPDRDLEALSDGLGTLGRPEASLGDVLRRVEGVLLEERVDVAEVRRLVEAGRAIADLRWQLGSSADEDTPPSAVTVVVARGPATEWAIRAPFHPFALPVVVDDTATATATARGIAAGQMADATAAAAQIRRARDLLEHPREAGRRPLPVPRWQELDDLERALCPPLVLLADERAIGEGSIADLRALLDEEAPIKVVLLVDDLLGPTGPLLDPVGLAALGRPVAQSSIAAGGHLVASVDDLLAAPGPGVLRLPCPMPSRLGSDPAATPELARRAVTTRVAPLYRWSPEGWALDGNAGEPPAGSDGATPIHWLLELPAATHRFRPVNGTEVPPDLTIALRDGLAESSVVDQSGALWIVNRETVASARRRLEEWERLVATSRPELPEPSPTPEPDEMAELEARYRAELASLRERYEQELGTVRSRVRLELAQEVRRRLWILATKGAPQ